MLEIFALPYFVVSGVIGWAVFSPFFRVNDSDSLSCSSVTTSDLLAISLPISVVFVTANWMFPIDIPSLWVQALVIAIALAFAIIALTTGLFLVPKTFQITFLKRMAIVGVIAPSGILLTLCWIGLLVWACVYSILYLIPSMIAVALATIGLRMLGLWVCQAEWTRQPVPCVRTRRNVSTTSRYN